VVGLRIRFGACAFDREARELRRDGAPVPLSPKALGFLQLLLEHRPRALSKAEIHDYLWPATFVAESSLTRLAAELRAALGDDARKPRFVRTVFGFGYAFSGETIEEAAPPASRQRTGSSCRLAWGNREIPLAEGENLLGRVEDATVWIDSPKASRRHARIVVSGGRALLEDLGSRNGTFLRGKRLREPAPLADGDEICVGPVVLIFRSVRATGTTETDGLP
jgi:DNA-binding winged helix-turn-helix (wHTH) protein